MIVVKFGGTSVADADAIRRAAEIVRGRLDRRPVVVVSALSGTTNALLTLGQQAADGQLIGAIRAVEGLRERHMREAESLLLSCSDMPETCAELSATFDELASLVEALSVLGDLTPRSQDAIASIGERVSSVLAAASFRAVGIDAVHIDARDIVLTDEVFGNAAPQTERIAERAREHLLPLIRQGRVPLMGGYIGATARGITTTLGRGGSDYSASLIGAALKADAIEIWTDVDGMLTADPRVVQGAQLIPQIRFDEASELASFGAKVLHPSTIAPAVKLDIPVWVFNSRNPGGTGTRITFDAPRRPVSAIAGKTGTTVVRVRTPRMLLTHGFLRQVFEAFDRHQTSVDVVATSEVSVSVTVDDPVRIEDVIVDLRQLGDVSVERNKGIVAVVGAGMADDGRALARALTAVQEMKVQMVSLSASGINLTLLFDADDVAPAMRRLHDAFFGGAASAAAGR
jgi:aspartate kinase